MAVPQCAIAQPGSFSATAENVSTAAENQNECSSATPRLKSGCTAGVQEVWKVTLPTRWGDPAAPC
jgi:hypothetical protein